MMEEVRLLWDRLESIALKFTEVQYLSVCVDIFVWLFNNKNQIEVELFSNKQYKFYFMCMFLNSAYKFDVICMFLNSAEVLDVIHLNVNDLYKKVQSCRY